MISKLICDLITLFAHVYVKCFTNKGTGTSLPR